MLNRDQIFSAIQKQIDLCDKPFALMIVRVRGLREIGIRFGNERGEQAEENSRVLIAESLRPIDQVFRSGDESFAVVLPEMLNQNHALLAATRLVKAFELPLNSATSPWQGRAIMGVVFFPEHGAGPDMLCRHAEIAVDEAQQRGEHCIFFQPNENQTDIFFEELRDAIEFNRLRAYFQPIWNLETDQMTGAESLARWASPRGDIQPADFIPFAEQSDLISALTRWSINATLRHAAAMRAAPDFTFAINLSPRAFARPGLVEQLMDALNIWDVSPTSVVAEITETSLVNDLDLTVNALHLLRDKGMRIAIDDFGTGYSSIAYLRKFPATELKIDKSLIISMGEDRHTERLVRAVIKLAHDMDLTTVAEGIEDQPTKDMLIDMGCDFGQGYHLGRPEPAEDFVARFTAKKTSR